MNFLEQPHFFTRTHRVCEDRATYATPMQRYHTFRPWWRKPDAVVMAVCLIAVVATVVLAALGHLPGGA